MSEIVAQIVGENQTPAGPSETPASIDFGALRKQAEAMMDKAMASDEPEAPVEAKEVTPPPQRVKGATTGKEPAKQVETKVETSAEAVEQTAKEALELSDDQLVKVVVDGEEQVLPWKDARGKISGGLKFTQNMQQLAKEREAVEASKQSTQTLAEERDALRAILNNRKALVAFLKTESPELFSPAQVGVEAQTTDAEIADVGQVRRIAAEQGKALESRLEELNQAVETRIVEATQEIEARQQTAKHAFAINNTLAEIYAKNPILKAIPDSEDIIRYNVAKMKPKTEEEALEAFRTVAGGIVEELGKHQKASTKVQAVVKAKLETKSIEPPGGAAPQTQPTNYRNPDGSVNWNKVAQMAREYAS